MNRIIICWELGLNNVFSWYRRVVSFIRLRQRFHFSSLKYNRHFVFSQSVSLELRERGREKTERG